MAIVMAFSAIASARLRKGEGGTVDPGASKFLTFFWFKIE